MCGRYSQTNLLDALKERFSFDAVETDYPARYNIAPGQIAPVIVSHPDRTVRLMKWGLIPSWATETKIGFKMINARAETIAEKKTFKRLLPSQRCLILSDGFYEWRQEEGQKTKIPMRFVITDQAPFGFAGLYDRWVSPDGEEITSFTIITTAANDLIRPVHHRMPVILTAEDEKRWLDPELKDIDQICSLLKQYPPDRMSYYDVATTVNSPRNDIPECIVKVDT